VSPSWGGRRGTRINIGFCEHVIAEGHQQEFDQPDRKRRVHARDRDRRPQPRCARSRVKRHFGHKLCPKSRGSPRAEAETTSQAATRDRKGERGGGVKVVKEKAEAGQLTFTDLARANV
jgi:hypothetical protein